MSKLEVVKQFFTNNCEKEKDWLINRAIEKYDMNENTARTYYQIWKKEYMKGSVQPKMEKKTIKENKPVLEGAPSKEVNSNSLKIVEQKVKGENNVYTISKDGVSRGDLLFKSYEEIAAWEDRMLAFIRKEASELREAYKMKL